MYIENLFCFVCYPVTNYKLLIIEILFCFNKLNKSNNKLICYFTKFTFVYIMKCIIKTQKNRKKRY